MVIRYTHIVLQEKLMGIFSLRFVLYFIYFDLTKAEIQDTLCCKTFMYLIILKLEA